MTHTEELFTVADTLKTVATAAAQDEVAKPVEALASAAQEVGRSFSGSWQGYHSRVYYEDFLPPPPGAHFSQEWGLNGPTFSSLGTRGEWLEHDPKVVRAHIGNLAGKPDIEKARKAADTAENTFKSAKSAIISILETELGEREDAFLKTLREKVEKLEPLSPHEIAQCMSPKGPIMTRDSIVVGQKAQVPPHIQVMTEAESIRQAFSICHAAEEIAREAGAHLERKSRRYKISERSGSRVFIGHGRSPVWRELKDFVQDRLKLPWDEFNRVPIAGLSNTARLSDMLNAATIAFLVMTAEDERADGAVQARMNVVHEAGLFQGRLGFTKAIIMLEEGCDQFSNMEGLGQIRFPSGNIAAAFEEVRRVLERERLVEPYK